MNTFIIYLFRRFPEAFIPLQVTRYRRNITLADLNTHNAKTSVKTEPSPSLSKTQFEPKNSTLSILLAGLGEGKLPFIVRDYIGKSVRLSEVNQGLANKNTDAITLKKLTSEKINILERLKQIRTTMPCDTQQKQVAWNKLENTLNSCARSRSFTRLDCSRIQDQFDSFVQLFTPPAQTQINRSHLAYRSGLQRIEKRSHLQLEVRPEITSDAIWLRSAINNALKEVNRRATNSQHKQKSLISPLKADDIISGCAYLHFPIQLFIAFALVESGGGLLGRGAKHNNPLNFGNDDSGHNRHYQNWQKGIAGNVKGMEKAGFYNRYDTLQDFFYMRQLKGYYGLYCPPKGTGYATSELPKLTSQIVEIMNKTPKPH